MFMFLKLAWGNVLKNRRSSITILIVVFVCVFFMDFGVAFMDGFKSKILGDFLNEAGHINIYDSRYYKEMDFVMNEYNVNLTPELLKAVKTVPGVKTVRAEINFGAIANTQTENLECMVRAIDPENASDNYTKLASSVIKGSFIKGDKDILVGERGAKLLGTGIGQKLVILSVDQYGSISAVEGNVVGIYKTFNAQMDERGVLCALPLAQKLLSIGNSATKVTVNLNDPVLAPAGAQALQKILPAGLIAVSWQTGQAFIVSYLKLLDASIFVIAFIIIFGASMGIINSFLMNVMNRLPEFGALRAMGLGKGQMFLMIITESLFLGIVGTVLAIIPGTALVLHYQAHPFNYERILSTMQGTPMGAMDSSIGTAFVPATFAIVILTGILISVLASSYPALIAVSKKPSEIMRVLE